MKYHFKIEMAPEIGQYGCWASGIELHDCFTEAKDRRELKKILIDVVEGYLDLSRRIQLSEVSFNESFTEATIEINTQYIKDLTAAGLL